MIACSNIGKLLEMFEILTLTEIELISIREYIVLQSVEVLHIVLAVYFSVTFLLLFTFSEQKNSLE